MKKALTFLAALGFLSTSSLSVIACGTGPGPKIPTIKDAPKKAKDSEDPKNQYVYNNNFLYDNYESSNTIGNGGQLAIDKIRVHKQADSDNPLWKEFYNSAAWINGTFEKIGLDTTAKPQGEHDFSYTAKNKQELFMTRFKDNDASIDTNKIRIYWFITSKQAWSEGSTDFQPTSENIDIPPVSDFSESNKQIKRDGYLHLYLLIAGFRIDFSAQITFVFEKVVDKNGIPVVGLNSDTWNIPYGQKINPEDPSPVYNSRIANVVIKRN